MVDTFTPEQITQILEEFFKVVGTRKYIGERYVPIFGRKGEESIQWDNSAPYEPLTIVLYQGNSYTSRQYVPIGVEITNQEFWVITGNYNAQVEAYHRETIAAREIADNAITTANNAQTDINTLLPKADFSAENTVKKYIDENPTRILTFDTVVDMQAATILKSGMVCHTNGFHAIGDGGAAYYTVSASGTANGMDVLALQNGLYAALVVTEPYVTPEQLGAYGDGTHDDSGALEKCAAYDCPIRLVNDYFLNQKTTLRNSIFGDGKATITLPDVEGVYLQNDLDDAIIEGVVFQSSSKSGYTLYISQSNNTVENCTFQNSGVAIRAFAGINIHDCRLHNVAVGIYVSNTSEDINISDISIENDLDYKTELLAQAGMSGILLEETTSVANISNVYMSNILENFIYAQAKRVHISDGMFVNGLVVKVVGFDDTMAELADVKNLTFIDTDEARHTGSLNHVQIYNCIDTIYDSINYIGSKSYFLFAVSRECGNVTIKNVTGTFISQFVLANSATIGKLLLENIDVKYSALPSTTGIVSMIDSTISELDIIDSQYIIDTIAGVSNRFFYTVSNSTITKALVIGRTNEPFYNPSLLDGIHNIEILSNVYTLVNLFALYNNIRGKNVVIRHEGITLAANSVNTSGNVINLVIARYRSIGVNANVNARIIVYTDNDVQEYTLVSGLLTKLSGTYTYVTQANSGDNLLLRGDIKTFNMDIKLLN